MKTYSEVEILQNLSGTIPFWSYDRTDICREFSFSSYLESVEFVNQVAKLSEEIDHHPVILILWKRILVKLHTHSRDGVTTLDFELAEKIDKIYASFSG